MISTSFSKPNTSGARVFVGLSGGVDSAVSAALLKEQGYDVVGVFIRIVLPGYPCTAAEDRIDAMRVAAHLDLPFVEIDLSKEYQQKVFDVSIEEFERGETPNPDVLCNREIKFGLFYAWARAQGADFVATGHYARTQDGLLYAGADKEKDQSYFLWSTPQEVLRHALFPIGEKQKSEVRTLAKKFDLPNAQRPDSQGLCFLGPISVEDMLRKELELKPGKVLSEEGEVIGEHEGAARYTLGQRHGFVLKDSGGAAHFVISKDIAQNTITVSTERFPRGAKETLITLRETNWIGELEGGAIQARYRYRQKLMPANKSGDTVVLHEPHYVPLGQSLVLYRDERCLGGGIVEKASLTA